MSELGCGDSQVLTILVPKLLELLVMLIELEDLATSNMGCIVHHKRLIYCY